MDPIELFIKNQQKFSLTLLTTAHSRLSVLQLQKGCVTQEDTQQSLRSQLIGQQMTAADISAHAGLLFESIISPSISATGQVRLAVKKDMVGNDEKFIGAILDVVTSKCGGVEYPWVEEFKQESLAYLARLLEASKPMTEEVVPERPDVYSPPEFTLDRTAAPAKISHRLPSPATNPAPFAPAPLPPVPVQSSLNLAPPQALNNATSASGLPVEYDGPEEHKYAPARVEFERAEPIVRLLAQVRKVGMDILFPQSTHDKVCRFFVHCECRKACFQGHDLLHQDLNRNLINLLTVPPQILAIIFVAVRSFATPAHRELIDMVMTVKESGKVSQLEPVSKTKIRGVLALLKHGELLTTQGEYGEPVRLSLAPGIETFKDLRERHDGFLNMYMMDHHLFIPTVLRTELVWQLDEETRAMRLEAMDRLVLKLKLFFSSHAEYSAHALDRDSSGSISSTSTGASSGGAAAVAADPSFKQPAFGPGGYGGRGPNNKYGNMGPPMAMQMQMPGGGRGAGRGYVPYGGRGAGRYGYSNYYNNGGGPFDGPYGAGGAGYGYPSNHSGGRFGGGYAARLAQQRLANAQASATWANNEDYAELANEDWGDGDATSSAAISASANGQGVTNGSRTNSNKNNVTHLSPQAPSFDPSQLKATAPTTVTGGKASGAHNHHHHSGHNAHHSLTPKTSGHGLGEMLSFDYSRLDANSPASGSASRLASLNGLNLIDPKDASTGRIEPSLDDGAWLAVAAAGGKSNFDFWNDPTSNFFDTLGSGNGGSTNSGISGGSGIQSNVVYNTSVANNNNNNELSFGLGELSLSRPYGSLAPATGSHLHKCIYACPIFSFNKFFNFIYLIHPILIGLFSGGGGLNMHTSVPGLDSSLDPVYVSTSIGAAGSNNKSPAASSLDLLSPVPSSSLSPVPNQGSNFSFADNSTSLLSTSNSVLND